jgi:hypothetical protein
MKRVYHFFLGLLVALGGFQTGSAQNVLDLAGLNESAATTVAYSVRKLSTSYTGNCMQVRRSSDNTVQDIGFTAGGELDITGLQAFAGTGDAFVVTWYDQSGNANHLTQATEANQPRIVSAGNTDLENGKPFIRFFGELNGNYHSLNLASEMNTTGQVAVVNKFSAGGDGFILGHTSYYYWHTEANHNQLVDQWNAGSSYKTGKFWQNGASVAPDAAVFNTSLMVHSIVPADPGTETGWDNIGSDRNYYHNTTGGGGYAELIVFASELNIYSRNSLAENQGAYFGITITPVAYLNKYGRMVTGETEFVNRNGGLGTSSVLSSGESVSRSALSSAPVTRSVSSITAYSATSGGNISSDNGANLKAGISWSTSPSPTTGNSKTIDRGSAGSYTSSMTGLRGNTTYYVRAYASNNVGTQYGNQLSFTTSPSVLPIFSGTNRVSFTGGVSAKIESTIATDGGASISEKGFCWSTSPNPTIADTLISSTDSSTGLFSTKLTGLSLATTYYVRAYATTSVGTAYGTEIQFTTDSVYGVGDHYQGGIIAYVFAPTDSGYVAGETHGLIVTENDEITSQLEWTMMSYDYLNTSDLLGTGMSNTQKIDSANDNYEYLASYACSSLSLNGYDDWYLPSKDELNKIYLNKALLPNFRTGYYWTSSEYSDYEVWVHDFSSGNQVTQYKWEYYNVRSVRSF